MPALRSSSARFAAVALGAAALATAVGCTPSRTYVLQPPVGDFPRVQSVALRPEPATVEVSPKLQETIDKAFAHNLENKYGIALADYAPLEVHYRIVHYDPGNVLFRVVSNLLNLAGSPVYGVGDGGVAVEVRFVEPGGRDLGTIVSDGPIAGAFGSTSDAAGTAAHSVSDFVNQHYAKLPAGAKPATAGQPAEAPSANARPASSSSGPEAPPAPNAAQAPKADAAAQGTAGTTPAATPPVIVAPVQ